MELLTGYGIRQEVAKPCVFRNQSKDLRLVAHGGDIGVLGGSDQLNWCGAQFSGSVDVKLKTRFGDEAGHDMADRLLTRIAELDKEGMIYEAD